MKSSVVLVVRDDGIGFDLQAQPRQGFGLRNMASRAKKIGGRFKITSHPETRRMGTHITVTLPTHRKGRPLRHIDPGPTVESSQPSDPFDQTGNEIPG